MLLGRYICHVLNSTKFGSWVIPKQVRLNSLTAYNSVALNDSLSSKILSTTSIEELSDVINNCDFQTHNQVCMGAVKLQKLAYQNLEIYSWFQGHAAAVSHIQLSMNKRLKELMTPVIGSRAYDVIYKNTGEFINEFDSESLSNTLLSLKYIGLDGSDQLMINLLLRGVDLCDDATFHGLANFSSIRNVVAKYDPLYASKIMNRYSFLLRENPDDLTDITDFYRFVMGSYRLCSPDLIKRTLTRVCDLIKNNEDNYKNPDDLGSILMLCRKIGMYHTIEKNFLVSYVMEAIENKENMNEFHDNHIASICFNTHLVAPYCMRRIEKKVQERAYEISRENKKLSTISNLIYCGTVGISEEHKNGLEDALNATIHDADVLILSNLADSFQCIKCKNPIILDKFDKLVLENLDYFFEFPTRLKKILIYLKANNFSKSEYVDRFIEHFLTVMPTTQLGISSWCINMVSSYLLLHNKNKIPKGFYDKLLNFIPQGQISELYPIVVAMNSNKDGSTGVSGTKSAQVLNLVYYTFVRKINEIKTLHILSKIVNEILDSSVAPDPYVITKLIKHYEVLVSKHSSNSQLLKMLYVHSQLCFSNPDLFNWISAELIERGDLSGALLNKRFLFTVANTGFLPNNADVFFKCCIDAYNKYSSQWTIYTQLAYILALSDLQCFNKELLLGVFNIDYLEKVDQKMKERPEIRAITERYLMRLNRAVVLESPELDIPWFHETYCKENIVDSVHSKVNKFRNQVGDSLTNVLGHEKYIKKWVYTPYYHYIDFVLFLDEGNNLIPFTKSVTPSRRIAIRTLNHKNFCYRSKEPNGFEKTVNRQLEIMGYEVVQIPHYEWNSMGLTDLAAKNEYVRKKLKLAHVL